MLVSELKDRLRDETTQRTHLGDIEVDDMAGHLQVGSQLYPLDEVAERAVAKFLKVPHRYLRSCPPEFRATTMRFWLEQHAEVSAQIDSVDGQIVSIHDAGETMLPAVEVAGVVASVFSPDDTVRMFRDSDLLHLDVVSRLHRVDVPNPDRVPFRPLVGDVTAGGVRVVAYPHQVKAPQVSAYLERLVCANGMCAADNLSTVAIKGSTVPEVLAEMESAARRVLAGLDKELDRYAASASHPVPGSLQAFAHQLARERGLTRAVLDRVMNIVNQLPADTATVYDVIQAFTSVANEDLPYATRVKLQGLGGALALDTERVCARCSACERLLA